MSVTIHVHQSYSSHDITPLGRVLDRKIFSSQAFVQVSPNLEPKLGTESAMSFRTETDKKEAKDSENMQHVAILAIFLGDVAVSLEVNHHLKGMGGSVPFWMINLYWKNGGSETNPEIYGGWTSRSVVNLHQETCMSPLLSPQLRAEFFTKLCHGLMQLALEEHKHQNWDNEKLPAKLLRFELR